METIGDYRGMMPFKNNEPRVFEHVLCVTLDSKGSQSIPFRL